MKEGYTMKQNTHTPGPWTIEPVSAAMSTNQRDFIISHSDGELRSHIARLFGNALCREHGDIAANARLIAAAPALLAALDDIVSRLGRNSTAMANYGDLVAAGRKAIASARGEG